MMNFDSAIAFDAMKIRSGGVELSKCSCTGSSSYFLPKGHIDFISSTHKFYFKTFFVGLILLAVGIYAMASKNFNIQSMNDKPWTWLLPGLIIIFIAMVAMIPSTLTIASNSATFVSTNCCNEKELLMLKEWLSDTPLIAAPAQAAAFQPVVFANPQLSPTSIGQSPDMSQLMDSRQMSPRGATEGFRQQDEGSRNNYNGGFAAPSAAGSPLSPRSLAVEMVPNQPALEMNKPNMLSPRRSALTITSEGRTSSLNRSPSIDVSQSSAAAAAASYGSAPVTYRMLPTASQPSAPIEQQPTIGRTASVVRLVRSESPSPLVSASPTSARSSGGAAVSAWTSPAAQTTESAYRSVFGQSEASLNGNMAPYDPNNTRAY